MPPPVIEITSKKEITLRALIIFCMREAFLKALPPVILIVFVALVSLLPLALVTQSSLPRKTPPLPTRLLQ